MNTVATPNASNASRSSPTGAAGGVWVGGPAEPSGSTGSFAICATA